ncbi:MAG: Crp/Fnr family transcriptional regulator [Peptococcaceae bacterium BICA1-8]|nr:MAG: Crp/Fnr family transcriptional regulator [Peptococcaceae bacterium BICA1-8]
MVFKFLRENVYASYFLALVRVYLGWSWITAGWGKITGGFDATGFLVGAVKKSVGDHPAVQGWWASFLEGFAMPNAGIFNFMIPAGEFLVGLGLIVGGLTTLAVFFGMMMNFAFLFSGSTSTNVQMILLSIFVIVAGANAGRLGIDYYILPYLRKHLPFLNAYSSSKLA